MVFAVPALILPLILGIIILFAYRTRLGRLLAAFSLKPVIATPLWASLIAWAISYPNLAETNSPLITLSLLPGVVLTLIIVLIFKDLYRPVRGIPYLFLALDLFRWLDTYAMVRSLYPDGISLLFIALALGAILLPSAYAVLALAFLRAQKRTAATPA